LASLVVVFDDKEAFNSSTHQDGGKRRADQAADWISPVNAARNALSRSASVKPPGSRARTRLRKTPRFSTGTLPTAAQTGPKLRIGEGDHVARREAELRDCVKIADYTVLLIALLAPSCWRSFALLRPLFLQRICRESQKSRLP
jgi:hypothetical protein